MDESEEERKKKKFIEFKIKEETPMSKERIKAGGYPAAAAVPPVGRYF